MADIQKPDLTKQWASSGDKTPPSDALLASGWNSGDIPSNTDFNYIDARQDQGLAYLLQKGVPEWDSGTEYQANKSYVQYGGKVYKCIQTGTNKQPDTQLSYWRDEQGVSPSRTIMSFDGTGVADGSLISFAGRDTVGDGGGGPLRFLSGSTATADGVTIYTVTGGRLVREGWSVFGVNPLWAGAKGGGADDTIPLQKTMDVGVDVIIPAGYAFKATATVTVTSTTRRKIVGPGKLVQGANDINVLDCSNAQNVTIQGVEFEGYASTAAGTDFTKNQAVYASGGRNINVLDCEIHGFSFNGVQLRNVFDYRIESNLLYGNYYDSPSGSDILLYSNIDGARGAIRGNRCYSNNSQGIYVNAVGGDRDVIVSGNFCHTLNPVDWSEITDYSVAAGTLRNSTTYLQRRHGIIFGYSASSNAVGRFLITNNDIRSTQWSGIYRPLSSFDPGPATVTNNIMSNVSMQNAAAGSLEGGLLILACGAGDIYDGNQIFSVGNGNANKAGVKFAPGAGFSGSARITNNTIKTAGMGVWVGGYLQERVIVADNDLYNFYQRGGIYYAPSNASATISSQISLWDNLIDGFDGSTYDKAAIYLDFSSPSIPQNVEIGGGAIRARADTSYWGISFRGLGTDDALAIGGGISIEGVENAVWNETLSVGRFQGLRLGRVTVRNSRGRATCEAFNMGYNSGANGSAFALVEAGGGVYQGVTKVVDNRGGAKTLYQGVWLDNDRVEVVHTGIPTTGCWVRGDRIVYEAPSGSAAPGAVCVTGGQFGTLSGITAATTSGSTAVTFSSTSGLSVGMFITIAGVTGTKRIVTLSGTSATVDSVCDATVAGGAVAYVTPVFKAMANLAA